VVGDDGVQELAVDNVQGQHTSATHRGHGDCHFGGDGQVPLLRREDVDQGREQADEGMRQPRPRARVSVPQAV
jgi:hypothetical protein